MAGCLTLKKTEKRRPGDGQGKSGACSERCSFLLFMVSVSASYFGFSQCRLFPPKGERMYVHHLPRPIILRAQGNFIPSFVIGRAYGNFIHFIQFIPVHHDGLERKTQSLATVMSNSRRWFALLKKLFRRRVLNDFQLVHSTNNFLEVH